MPVISEVLKVKRRRGQAVKTESSEAVRRARKFQRNWVKSNPWYVKFMAIRYRTNNKKSVSYKYYGARGIKCLITVDELKKIWFRDKAYLLKKPSIDRIDPDGHYEFKNCRFIELSENVRRSSCNGTHCFRGHKFSKENTYYRNDGCRECMACRRISRNKYKVKVGIL